MRKVVCFLVAFWAGTPALAETLYYRYDVLGRLATTFSDTSSFRTDYGMDTAGNRTSVLSRNIIVLLQVGQAIWSSDGRFQLAMQGDGNLVLYGPSGALWNSQTYGTAGSIAIMQDDGNLVLYTASGQPIWASNTSGHPGSELSLQNDGNLVIYDMGYAPIWSTGTGGH